MSELACLELAVLLWLVHLLSAVQGPPGCRSRGTVGPRDEPPPPASVLGGRAARAYRNYMESFPTFAALDLAFIATHHPPESGRFFGLRLALSMCRSIGIAHFAQLVWVISIIALVAMLIRLAL